jgi:hypothetical protein
MTILTNILRSLRIEEILSVVAIFVVALINVTLFEDSINTTTSVEGIIAYFNFGQSFFLFFFLALLGYFLWNTTNGIANILTNYFVRGLPIEKSGVKILLTFVTELLRSTAPLLFVFPAFCTLLAHLDYSLRFTKSDLILSRIDFFLTGHHAFLDVPLFFSTQFAGHALYYSYISLTPAIGILLSILYVYRATLPYREVVLAFLCSLIVALPIATTVPCQDPNNFFIKNLRANSLSPEMNERLSSFHPSASLQKHIAFIADTETDTAHDNAVPVTCLPSMHAVWGFLVLYYFARINRKTLFFTLPWIFAVLTGGLGLGQHYFVDYIAAIPCALLSVGIAKLLMKKWGTIGTPVHPSVAISHSFRTHKENVSREH